MRDSHGVSSEEAEDSGMDSANMVGGDSMLGGQRAPDEMIEVSPISDLIDKLEFKKTLSV